MSRIASKPIVVPSEVKVVVDGQQVDVTGPKGQMKYCVPEVFEINYEDNLLSIKSKGNTNCLKSEVPFNVLSGTTRANLNNTVLGVSQGYEKRLELVGIGYRGQVKEKVLQLTLGFSHPVAFNIPEGISIEMPNQTEINIKGIDNRLVGQVAANIRCLRPVEPYKGKGVRYKGEMVILKETKKK